MCGGSTHRAARHHLMASLTSAIAADVEFVTDSHSAHPELIARHFPHARHTRHLGAKASISGQGEPKKLKFDPIFRINQQPVMLRAT